MSARQSTGRAHDWEQDKNNRVRSAIASSERGRARLQGMKARARLTPPQAAIGAFPYPARTCAEWTAGDAEREGS